MADYSYAQLMTLWIDAGGPKAEAPIAAAIAEAESGGNSDALNPNDNGGRQSSFGLWQISNGTHSPPSANWANPAVNAQLAVGKWKGAGDSFSPWGTFTSGAYKAFLSSKTTPDPNVPGSGTQLTAQTLAAGSSDCLLPNPLSVSLPLVGQVAGPACLFSKSNARAFIGAGLMLAGGAVALAGLAVLAVAAGMRAVQPLGKAAEATGGALLLVPGAEGAGAAIGTAGRTARNPAREGRRRQAAGAREDAELERRMGSGPSRENKGLRTGRGAIRETPAETRRRKAAGRSRQRAASGDEPPF